MTVRLSVAAQCAPLRGILLAPLVAGLAGLLAFPPVIHAQEPGREATAAPAKVQVPASQTVALRDNVLGIKLGQSFAEAWDKLNLLGEHDGRLTRDGGKRYAWKLTDENSEFEWVVVRSNRDGRVTALTGFLRKGKELSLGDLGDLATALHNNQAGAVWDGRDASGKITYRLVAKGPEGKANVIYFMAAPRRDRNEVNVVLPPDQRPPPGQSVDNEADAR